VKCLASESISLACVWQSQMPFDRQRRSSLVKDGS
jgi:hypothetical protein